MATEIYTSLVGTDKDDVLAYREETGPDGTITRYTSIYGMGGDDLISIRGWTPAQYIDAGAGNDTVISYHDGFEPTATVLGGTGDDKVTFSGDTNRIGWRLDGGADHDELTFEGLFIARAVSNFEKLIIPRGYFFVKGQLDGFEEIRVGSAHICFLRPADLSDVHFSDTGRTILIQGSESADNLDLAGESSGFGINGKGGDDIIIAGEKRLNAQGGDGIDYIKGSDVGDVLSAGAPSHTDDNVLETVLGMGGDDLIRHSSAAGYYDGGEGNDTLQVATHGRSFDASRSIILNVENLVLSTSTIFRTTADFIAGLTSLSEGRLGFLSATTLDHLPTLVGDRLVLFGSREDDTVRLTDVSVKIIFDGGGGDDLFRGGTKRVVLSGDIGNDRLFGSSDNDKIDGDNGNDRLSGGDGRDNLYGGKDNDVLSGGNGNDRLDGGKGSDTVYGNDGNDLISMHGLIESDSERFEGGAGNDRFVYGSDIILGNTRPWIMRQAATIDFNGGAGYDSLVLSGNLSNVTARGVESFSFVDQIWAKIEFISSFDKINITLDPSKIEATIHLTTSGTLIVGEEGINAIIKAADGDDYFDFSKAPSVMQDVNLGGGDDVLRIGDGGTGNGGYNPAAVGGGAGNDIIFGGKGNDDIYDGTGRDTFVAGGGGTDYFNGFEANGKNADVIDLSHESSITDYKDLLDNHLVNKWSECYIDFGKHNRLYLEGSAFTFKFTEANFIF